MVIIQGKKEPCLTKCFKRNEEGLHEVLKEIKKVDIGCSSLEKKFKLFNFSLHPKILHASTVRWYMCYWTI